MKILIGNKGNVDFDNPIPMNKDQQNEFIEFMNELFQPVNVIEKSRFRTSRLGDKMFQRKWDDNKEIAMLIDLSIDTNELCSKLGRTWMSVNIHRGQIIPELMMWSKSKGYDISAGVTKELIEDYLKEKEETARLNRKKARDERNTIIKEMDKIRTEIENCETMIHTIELRIIANAELPTDSDTMSANKEKIKQLELDYSIKAIELNYEDDTAWNDKGNVLLILGRYDEALEAYDKAININPDCDIYWNNKGYALYYLERYEDSLKCYDMIIKSNSDDGDAWFTSASILSKMGHKEKALVNLAKAIEIDDDNKRCVLEDQDFEPLWTDSRFKKLVE